MSRVSLQMKLGSTGHCSKKACCRGRGKQMTSIIQGQAIIEVKVTHHCAPFYLSEFQGQEGQACLLVKLQFPRLYCVRDMRREETSMNM